MKDKRLLTLEERISVLEKKLRIVNEEENNSLISETTKKLIDEADNISDSIKETEDKVNKFIKSVESCTDKNGKLLMSEILKQNEVLLNGWKEWGDKIAKSFSSKEGLGEYLKYFLARESAKAVSAVSK